MKRFLKTLIPGVLLLGFLTTPAFAQSRIATVDLRKLFDNYWKTKQADAALKDRAAELDKSHKELLETYKKGKEDYQKLLSSASDVAVSADEKDKRKKAAEDKIKDLKDQEDQIRQFEAQAQTTLQEQRRRMRDNILTEIRTALTGRAKSGSFTLVVDTAAQTINETPVILFSGGDNDLTDALLTQLNAGAPVEIPKPAPEDQLKEKKATEKPAPKK